MAGAERIERFVTERCSGPLVALVTAMLLAGCDASAPKSPAIDASITTQTTVSPSESGRSATLPTDAFAKISDHPVSDELAATFQATLNRMARRGGMTAMVMSPDGTWAGATGKADGVRKLSIEDQFGIGSINKTVIAAQIMQLVEDGELDLGDPAAQHLPTDLSFDTNEATIQQLLSHRSGIPDYWTPEFERSLTTDPDHAWTTEELLKKIPDVRGQVDVFAYSSTNYVLLGLIIEQVGNRPLVEVLREGVLGVPRTKRLISQPEERPTAPMAMPFGRSTAALRQGGGYLPSTASVTSNGPGAVMASDAPSLARWWRALCSGEIVSQDSLNEMVDFQDEYGLGLFDLDPATGAVGHPGLDVGYAAWAGCVPDDGTVIVVLTNQAVDHVLGMGAPLLIAATTPSP